MVAVMEWHYKAAILSHDALIQGDLEKMRTRLARIIEKSLPASAPKSWRPHHARLHKAALSGVSGITSLDSAGSVMGDVAEACGACHAALKVGNIYFWPAPPDKDDKFKTTMRTHQWASERLWEGVTGPFEEAWPRGAEAMAATRIFKDGRDTVKASLRAREAELRKMGRKAKAATGLHQRAVIYGRLLSTCARCHQEAGVTIEPAKTTTPWQE
jgi:cytochrome c553